MPDSRDYICLSGAKELLYEVKLDHHHQLTYPGGDRDIEKNKKIIEEYLEHRYVKAYKKINADWHLTPFCYNSTNSRMLRDEKSTYSQDVIHQRQPV